jgi:hypothetical protein
MYNNYKKDIYTGISSIISQLSGQLFLENIKMEKQRTNKQYRYIITQMIKTPYSYLNGFFPYGLIQGFCKGFIVSLTKEQLETKLSNNNYNKNINSIIIGCGTGFIEALFLSPILYIRNQLNTKIMDSNIKSKNISLKIYTIFKGTNIYFIKRSVDWSTRYIFINNAIKYSPINNDIINTFIASGLSTIVSTPFDRLLPLIYSNQNIKQIYKQQKLLFFYKGFIFRFLSIGYYTTCLFFLPKLFYNL